MSWETLTIAPDRSHHREANGQAAYSARFDDVLAFHSPGLAPVARGDGAWHIRADGSAAYGRRFARTFGFYEGLAGVVGPDGWHHVTPEGVDAYASRYAWCGNFQGGRCAVREADGSYLHVDASGRPAYAERWRYGGDYRDGVAVVQAERGLSTHIDAGGHALHGRWFLDLDVFHKGYARAREDGGWTHVGADGEPIYARRFAAVEPFYNGQARVEAFDGGLEVIDESGETVVTLRPPRRSELAALSADLVGFWRTQTIAAAVRLGVIAALPATADNVAERCGLVPEGAHRLLRALGELKLARSIGPSWALTPRGALLLPDHPLTLADAAIEYAGPLSRPWERLPEALRAGSGWTAPDVFGDVARDEGRREGHHRMLRSYARHDYASVIESLGLRGDERIIDAGGGLGTLAGLVLEAHPAARVTVLERSEVVAQGRRDGSPPPRLAWHAANLLEPWGLSADVVLLSRVLHDWDDRNATRVLGRAREVLPLGGRVVIIEMVLAPGGVAGALCDLHLLVVTGGRERTASEFEELLDATGFDVAAVRAASPLSSVIVGVAR